jgi:ribonuclease BN (tRNA processing enzyme)
MIDGVLVLDAGAMTRGLSVVEQLKIDHIFLTHAHLDHVRDLGLLADNIFAKRSTPIELYCSDFTADALEKNYFNGLLWPDFLKIPNPSDPEKRGMLRMNRVKAGESFKAGKYTLRSVLVEHAVECHGIFVTDEKGATLCYSGDTGPTDKLWPELNAIDNLRAFIFEISFPNDMDKLAKVSGHLTPQLMAAELEKYKPKRDAPVLLYGMKPGYHEVLKTQVAELKDDRLTMLKPFDEIEL